MGTATVLFALGLYPAVLNPLNSVAIVARISVLAGLQEPVIMRKGVSANPQAQDETRHLATPWQ
jgi:microcompartment protein CcmK/EutM